MNLTLYIPSEITHEGSLSLEGDVRIDGIFSGSLSTDGVVFIGPNAQFLGSLDCLKAEIFGLFKGDLRAYQQVRLEASGSFLGKIDTQYAEIAQGAMFSGLANISPSHQDS
jgi:cytoskeletal protein CcmA (bactofilin family)